MNANPRATKWTRREALSMLGMGAAAAALPRVTSAAPSFPEGAVIRTILKDYPPEELGGGATLFHEHMSLAPDFLLRFRQYAAEALLASSTAVMPTWGAMSDCFGNFPQSRGCRSWRAAASTPSLSTPGRSAP